MGQGSTESALRFNLVVVGGGMAAERLLKNLTANKYSESILLISEEPCAGYNRVLLPDLLAGRCVQSDLMPSHTVTNQHRHEQHLIARVVSLDVENKTLRCADGTRVHWNKAILATGSRVATPEVLTLDCNRVQALRTLADVEALQGLPTSIERIAVVGGGLLGLEAAHALNTLGYSVTVLHRNSALMNHQLDREASAHLLASLEAMGLKFRLSVEVGEIHADSNSIASVSLNDGANLNVDLIIVATGNTPNKELAMTGGLEVEHGIRVNNQLQTSATDVWALGECAQHNGKVYAFVEPVYAQADWLAEHLCGGTDELQLPKPNSRLKVAGIELFCAGSIEEDRHTESVIVRQTSRGIYRRLEFTNNQLTGAVLLGDAAGAQAVLNALDTDVSGDLERENLVFGVG